MKTKIALLLVALAGVSSAVLAEMTNTPSALYAAPLIEKNDASKLLDPAGDCLTTPNPKAKEYWAEIEEKIPNWKEMLTPRFKKLVDAKRENMNFRVLSKDKRKNLHKPMIRFVLYQTDALGIYISTRQSILVVPLTFGAAEWIAPEKTPPINPQTKKPYVALSPRVKATLSEEDAVYLETLAEVLNENLHFMFSPIPQLSLKEMRKGAYLGKFLLVPTRFKPIALEDVSQDPTLKDAFSVSPEMIGVIRNRYKDYIPQTYYDEAYLMRHLADGNPLKFEIQKRLGAPLWNIGEIFPDIVTPFSSLSCKGTPSLGGGSDRFAFPFSVVPLTLGKQMIKGYYQNLTLQETYKTYFKSMRASFKTLQEDWQAELEKEGLSKNAQQQTPRQKALKEIDAQLQPFFKKAEHALDRQSEWCESNRTPNYLQNVVKNKVPHSLL